MKSDLNGRRGTRAFSLLEIIIVISIIALLAALVLSGGGDAPPSKHKITQATLQGIQSALENYRDQFGEYPEPSNPDETADILGKTYRIGAAKCLYQALRGDGHDAIKGAGGSEKSSPESDGKITSEEMKQVVFNGMPAGLWRKVGNSYILVDAFGHPIQYIKADSEKKNTLNTTYDLWSYADDDANTLATSKGSEGNARVLAKWLKNW